MAQAQAGRAGGWGPQMAQPNVAPGRNMMFQRLLQGGQGGRLAQPQPARPNVAADAAQTDRSPVARIRHLRQAAEHLAAAGYPAYAAKASNEIRRLEAALKQPQVEMKQPQPAAPAPFDKAATRAAPRRDFNLQQQTKPAAGRAPDANAAMLNEMRKLSSQVQQLGARMQKLEARGTE